MDCVELNWLIEAVAATRRQRGQRRLQPWCTERRFAILSGVENIL